ncbi:hypothetical protein SeLEV6574_g01738 [Synchytrium endobioticum]|nr:hypothetical protein SeLEV6574_g01738 [Synchytrium endobioticum]
MVKPRESIAAVLLASAFGSILPRGVFLSQVNESKSIAAEPSENDKNKCPRVLESKITRSRRSIFRRSWKSIASTLSSRSSTYSQPPAINDLYNETIDAPDVPRPKEHQHESIELNDLRRDDDGDGDEEDEPTNESAEHEEAVANNGQRVRSKSWRKGASYLKPVDYVL